ncbi:CASP-like protein 4B1 [Lotus japonicus]|uniref:CASP-like protein 4B1 n=1 Tax=Lotus japonicus TaxID=34305 RepID=UPI002585DC9D|nr:CASP-like protein 4B1 [Lotus japonicus]
MSTLEEEENSTPKIHVQTPPMAPAGDCHRRSGWRREDLVKRGSLGLRGIALLFSLISFIAMASNQHGDWREFDKYEEYRYLLAIAILSCLYTGAQVFRQVHELSTGKQLIQPRMAAMIDFIGDQGTIPKRVHTIEASSEGVMN